MKKLVAAGLAAAMTISAPIAYAGGPVIVEETVEEKPSSSVGILPIIIVGIALCAALCGNDDDSDECEGNDC